MPRIIGVDIPANKRVTYALQALYGIGPAIAAEIIERAKINPDLKASHADGTAVNSAGDSSCEKHNGNGKGTAAYRLYL